MFDWFTGPSLVVGIIVVVGIGVLVALGVRHLEARARRDEGAARLQQALTEALAHEPALAGSSVLPIVSMPWRGHPHVELTGWVTSAEMDAAALRAIRREVARLGQPIRLTDRLEVIYTARRPA
jgi:hypothetical protein